jgi:hypothetical protein
MTSQEMLFQANWWISSRCETLSLLAYVHFEASTVRVLRTLSADDQSMVPGVARETQDEEGASASIWNSEIAPGEYTSLAPTI